VKTDEGVIAEIEVRDTQIGGLLDPRPGVVEEHEQRPVPQREPTLARQATEKLLDLVAFEEARLGGATRFIGMAATC
jgi:hypothetical protein